MANSFIVRYGSMRSIGEFSARPSDQFLRNQQILVRTDRGIEWGEVLSEASEMTRKYLNSKKSAGRVLRVADEQDLKSRDELESKERSEFSRCGDMIAECKLQMQLVDVEHVFGGERIIFYYLAENRVDFRELVKDLAREFNTRIEMRQIGVRDEAKLLADYGDCGKPVCCNTHLNEMPPVSMKMAKMQKATLDPNKISGRCGRLKCCLRYEYDTYKEYQRELPKVGATVMTREGQGRVVAQEILAQKVLVNYEGGTTKMTDASDIVTVVSGKSKNPSES
ncbi:MAG: regulatory iron-sulfur-containing complex subunit RicT [Planctomycetaceae bacterium]|jgi:cell fate regulator YaaT (PSP1 superfamily)|nr:regulatory iron-sulfur-containing complex subunit RicT [Planctomycetaceae bacterium]